MVVCHDAAVYPPVKVAPTPVATIWLGLAVVAGFGPYVASGIRTEQVVVYGGLLVCLPFGGIISGLGPRHLLVALAWTAFALYVVFDSIGVTVSGDFLPGSLQAGVDNYVYPAAVLFMVGRWLAAGYTRQAALDRFCRIYLVLIMFNGGLAVVGLFADLSPILAAFWGGVALDGQSVAVLAANNGRLSGIFNQPVEAGVAYSLALFAAVHLFARPERGRDRPVVLGLAVLPILLGGVLCVSKIFLLCGLPLALWQAARLGRPLRRLLIVGGGLALGGLLAGQTGLTRWNGSWMLRMLIPGAGSNGLFAQYTADRFRTIGASARAWNFVLETRPWLGYGAGGLAVPYDSAWAEAVVAGGLLGVAMLAGVLLLVATSWWRTRARREPAEQRFATCVTVLCLASTLGLPVLTANRVALFLWILLALLLFAEDGPASRPLVGPGRPFAPAQALRRDRRASDTRPRVAPARSRAERQPARPGQGTVLQA